MTHKETVEKQNKKQKTSKKYQNVNGNKYTVKLRREEKETKKE